MSNRNDFIPNKLSFNSGACFNLLKAIFNAYLDDLSQKLVEIVYREIGKNGNGSKLMRLSAMAEVKETKREITNDMINLEVGIDMEGLKKEEQVFVRVSVVLHGNLDGAVGSRLYTKPGQLTYKKHVMNKSMSTAKSVYPLPEGFEQGDVMVDIVDGVSKNTQNSINKYVSGFAKNVRQAIKTINFGAFLTVTTGG